MNQLNELETRLEELGNELSGPPDFVQRVLSEATNKQVHGRVKVTPPARRSIRSFAVLATVATLMLAVGWWMMQPTSLYAQAVAALQKVDVVHATGWTTRVVRKWPLESDAAAGDDGKHQIDAWYWSDSKRMSHVYEAMGPVTTTRNGDTLNEYQRDADLLFVLKSEPNDFISRFESLSEVLRALEMEGNKTIDLGSREVDGKVLRGTRLQRDSRTEDFWFDVSTHLPVSFTRSRLVNGRAAIDLVLNLSYQDPLPDAIASYTPPETENMRYGGQVNEVVAAWSQHVQNVGIAIEQDQKVPLPRIIKRTGQKVFSYQHTKQTPDNRFCVIPLGNGQTDEMSVKDFIRFRVSSSAEERELYRWRVEGDLADITFKRSDLVCEADTSWQEWTAFALGTVGLEFTTVEEEREFWIANHDGVTRKPYIEVNPPVPSLVQGGREQPGLVKLGVGHALHPVSLKRLFSDFHSLQNSSVISGTHPIIVDQTGFPNPPAFDRSRYASWDDYTNAVNYDQYLVASDSPWFVGEGSLDMARQWYQKELGITFDPKKRKLKTYIVRRK